MLEKRQDVVPEGVKAGPFDMARIVGLAAVRKVNHLSIERWSRHTYHPWLPARDRGSRLVRAREHYRADDLPEALWVASPTPPVGRLNLLYVWPYYVLTALAFRLYHRWPIAAGVAWDPLARYNAWFQGNAEGWANIQQDDAFVAMRLQGPNPFLLSRSPDDPNLFLADYRPVFQGISEDVVCRFELRDKALNAHSIQIAGRNHVPTDPDWHRAKLEANALDARYAIFAEHLLTAHFLVAQAYALATWRLPANHALADVLRLHTNGVLEVNDFAFRLLLTETSYFMQSGFVDRPAAMRLFENRIAAFRLDELIPAVDIGRRGLAAIPGHPYVEDANDIWPALLNHAEEVVATVYASDAALADDQEIRRWHADLVRLLPRVPDAMATLETRADLALWLACLLYNNVVHEVSGDFSPYAIANDAEQKRLIRWSTVHGQSPPSLHDVFLFEQGAYAGLFNTAGNNLMATPFAHRVRNPRMVEHIHALRRDLASVDERVTIRNRTRKFAFLRMLPRQWELSVSF